VKRRSRREELGEIGSGPASISVIMLGVKSHVEEFPSACTLEKENMNAIITQP
jgi:hypothetical protein